ncbi:MAG: hypothetical protein AB1485_01130 [Candidatus Thermoplasmatota archaeon]
MIILIGSVGLIILLISWFLYVKKHAAKKVLVYSGTLYTVGCIILIAYALLIKDIIFSILNAFIALTSGYNTINLVKGRRRLDVKG